MKAEVQEVQDVQESSQHHRLPIGLPIGAVLTAIGAILFLFGLLGASEYQRSLGINVNLWWGLLMFAFGLLMIIVNYFSLKRSEARR